jgi:hypothetical protein
VRHDVRQLCGATHSPDGLASCDVCSRADATGSKLGNERCPDRQHAADADAGGSKMIRSRAGTADAPCFQRVVSLFSLCYLLLEKSSKSLILLRQIFCDAERLGIEAAQHGHRESVLASATINRRRMVATEFGMWRSGRNGGSSWSVTIGYGRFREQRGGTRS